MQFRHMQISKFSLFQENRQRGDYRVLRWPDANGSQIAFFVNQTYDNPELRPVFQDIRSARRCRTPSTASASTRSATSGSARSATRS